MTYQFGKYVHHAYRRKNSNLGNIWELRPFPYNEKYTQRERERERERESFPMRF